MNVHVPDTMQAIFDTAGGVSAATKQAALSIRSAVDMWAIDSGKLTMDEADELSARIAVKLQMEQRLRHG